MASPLPQRPSCPLDSRSPNGFSPLHYAYVPFRGSSLGRVQPSPGDGSSMVSVGPPHHNSSDASLSPGVDFSARAGLTPNIREGAAGHSRPLWPAGNDSALEALNDGRCMATPRTALRARVTRDRLFNTAQYGMSPEVTQRPDVGADSTPPPNDDRDGGDDALEGASLPHHHSVRRQRRHRVGAEDRPSMATRRRTDNTFGAYLPRADAPASQHSTPPRRDTRRDSSSHQGAASEPRLPSNNAHQQRLHLPPTPLRTPRMLDDTPKSSEKRRPSSPTLHAGSFQVSDSVRRDLQFFGAPSTSTATTAPATLAVPSVLMLSSPHGGVSYSYSSALSMVVVGTSTTPQRQNGTGTSTASPSTLPPCASANSSDASGPAASFQEARRLVMQASPQRTTVVNGHAMVNSETLATLEGESLSLLKRKHLQRMMAVQFDHNIPAVGHVLSPVVGDGDPRLQRPPGDSATASTRGSALVDVTNQPQQQGVTRFTPKPPPKRVAPK